MAITNLQQTQIIQLYQIMFNAAPGAGHLNSLAGDLTTNNASMIGLANELAGSSLFTQSSLYPTTLTNTEFAERFVSNVVGGTVSDANHSWAVSEISNMLNAGQTRGEVMLIAAEALAGASSPEWADAAAQFNNQVEVGEYYSVDLAGTATDLATLRAVTTNVTHTAASLAAGKAVLDTAITGTVQDGYISGATIFSDLNGDGIQNPDEPSTTTDAHGNFTLPAGSFGHLIASGGTDIATNLPFIGNFTAPAGSTVINSLTTLVQSMVEQGTDMAEAMTQVQTSLGLPANIDLTTFDPIAETSGANADAARDILAASVQVNNLFTMAASVMTNADAMIDIKTVFAQVATALTEQMTTATAALDLTDANILNEILIASAGQDQVFISSMENLNTDLAHLIADTNSTIAEIIASDSDPETMLSQIMQVATVAQGEASEALLDAIENGTGLTHILSDYTGDAFDDLVNDADLGDVDGDGTTDLPIDLHDTTPDPVQPPTPDPAPEPAPVSAVLTLTSGLNNFTGTAADNTFLGTFIQDGTGTFNINDALDGSGGADTLDITVGGEAITPTDDYWTEISNIEKVAFNTTGAGAQTITTGAEFNTAFATAGVDLTSKTTSGAINIDLTSFTGAATITAATSVAGAQTITTGDAGTAAVTATSNEGAQTISGANLASVTATTIVAGAQTITTGSTGTATVIATSNNGAQTISGGNLASVTASAIIGAQTISSTGASAVTLDATSGAGATTISTGAGNDTINLHATSAAGANVITAGAGADAITLVTGAFAATDTINQADGDSKAMTAKTTTDVIAAGQTITFGNGLDIIHGFVGGTDVLSVGTAGVAVTGLGLNDSAFTATKTIFLSGEYVADTGVFTIAADGAGADTLLLDTTAVGDQVIGTADTWTLLSGTNSATLIASSFNGDGAAPILASSTPAVNATSTLVGSNLVLTFSEAVALGTGDIVLMKTADNSVVETFNAADGTGSGGGTVTASGTGVTINPVADLAANTGYYVTVAATAVTDTAGDPYSGISSTTDFTFATGAVFTLTAAADTGLSFTGTAADDTFAGTYIQNGTGTFNISDALDGAGGIADTLDITVGGEAITPTDDYWTEISNIEKVAFNTTGAGAQTITTGAEFNTAFAAAGVDLTSKTISGAINIDLTSFTGAATINAATSVAGAQTITTGDTGTATVTATSNEGAQTISGANLASVTATTIVAGAQTITTGSTGTATVIATSNNGAQTISGANLASVTASAIIGAQTITSTGASAVTVDATSGTGATTVSTGAGNDSINLYATSAAGANVITAGAGADAITLVTGVFAATDTINQADGDSKAMTAKTTTDVIAAGQTITFGNGLDIIHGFVGGTDVLSVGTGGVAVTGLGLNDGALTATKTIFLSGEYVANTGVFTIAADGAGADTLLLDTTAIGDQSIATADTWVLLSGANSGTLIESSFYADTTAPTLFFGTPADNATAVAVSDNIVLTFSEDVAAGTGDFLIKKAADDSTVATIAVGDATQVTFNGTTGVTINPSVDLAVGTAYYVTMAAGVINDTAGNNYAGISSTTALNFTTLGTGFTLTTSADTGLSFTGTEADDTFAATYDAGAVSDTLSALDVLDGGVGTADTLSITTGAFAITPPDALWTGITNIEKVVFDTTGIGAQNITTGALFDAAFTAAGVDLTAQTTSGAIDIDMSTFTGAAQITAATSISGAQTITTSNTGLAAVTATSNDGAQTISGANLASVTATAVIGAQTITSTGASAVTVAATSGSGATTIITGGGNDTITLYATDAAGANVITAGAGADAINLVTGGFAAIDTINQADGDSKAMTVNTTTGAIAAGQTITFGNGLDVIQGFAGGTDVLNVGTGGAAVTGIGLNEATLTATQTIFLSGGYAADTGLFTIAADGLGADTLLLDTTAVLDQDITTADTWILLLGTDSGSLIASSFV